MRVGVLTHNYPRFAGDFSGHFVADLSAELARQGLDVTVLAPDDAAYDATRPRGAFIGPGQLRLHTYRYAWPRRWQQLGYMRSMRADVALRGQSLALAPFLLLAGTRAVSRWVERVQPDILHAHWLVPNGFIGALVSARYGVPLVVSIPGSDASVAASHPLFRQLAAFTLHQAGLITANSADLRDVAIHELGAEPGRFDLILYGVDADALRPAPVDGAQAAAWRSRLAIPPDAVVALAVGRMVYKKGFDVLLRALPLLADASPPVHAVLIGQGDLYDEWRALARQLGVADRAHFAGTVPYSEIGDWYRCSDLLVMPSVTRPADGLNVCVLDAMACGRPVIGSTAAGNPLAVADGETGFIVPEGDAAALAAALRRLAADADLRAEMGRRARRRVEDELSWPHLARRYIRHFQRLALPAEALRR